MAHVDDQRVTRVLDALEAQHPGAQLLVNDPWSIYYLTGFYADMFERFCGVLLARGSEPVILVNALVRDIGIQPGEKVMLIINGSGATTLMEQLIIYRKCEQVLRARNIEIVANYVGELLTVQEQAGFQMFMARMDDELLRLWNAPCRTPYLTK